MKKRLDVLLAERGIATSRTAAAAMIMAGEVRSNDRILAKPGQLVDEAVELTIKDRPRYVSRGGDKLASVADELKLDFAGKVVLDVGSSTGGFTDFALQNGAAKVYAVDVGYGQLDWRLRQDSRVVSMEHSDIRGLDLPERADMAVMDLSFISLTKVLDDVARLVKPGGTIVAMAKPQFEAGKVLATKFKGVIKDEAVRQQVLSEFEASIGGRFAVEAWADSKVPGEKGNIERFYRLRALD